MIIFIFIYKRAYIHIYIYWVVLFNYTSSYVEVYQGYVQTVFRNVSIFSIYIYTYIYYTYTWYYIPTAYVVNKYIDGGCMAGRNYSNT